MYYCYVNGKLDLKTIDHAEATKWCLKNKGKVAQVLLSLDCGELT